MMIGVNDLLFPLFLGCIVSPVLIYLFCFFVFHLFLISDGFCYFENNKTKKKKKKIHPTTFFLLLHPYNSLGKRWWGMASFIYRKISSRNAKADTKFFCFFSKSLFFIRKKSFRLSKRDTQIGWVGWRPRPQRSVKWIPNGGKKRVCESHKEKNFFSRLFFFLFCCWFCSRPYPKCFQLMNLTKMKYRLRL